MPEAGGAKESGAGSPVVFDYHRTIIGYHGTTRDVADAMVNGSPISPSTNDDDWLGHGVYFWEYAPKQAWWWAQRRYGKQQAAVDGAMIRLGRCLDLLDPANVVLLKEAKKASAADMAKVGSELPKNANTHKFRDCVVFNHLYKSLDDLGYHLETCRAVFVPMQDGRLPRLWERSGGTSRFVSANLLTLWRYGM